MGTLIHILAQIDFSLSGTIPLGLGSETEHQEHLDESKGSGGACGSQRPKWVVGSTGDRNTLTFLRRWSVGDEAAEEDLLLGGPAG